jgi:hypothetical protein
MQLNKQDTKVGLEITGEKSIKYMRIANNYIHKEMKSRLNIECMMPNKAVIA